MNIEHIIQILEQIGKLLTDHSEALVAMVAIYMSYRQNSRDKQVENYLSLKSEFRSLWGRITAFPGETTMLLSHDITYFKGEKNEEMKLIVYQILDLFDDVYYYYQQSRKDVEDSDWHKQMKFVFSNPLFVSGFNKHKESFNDEFVAYVDSIIASNPPVVSVEEKEKGGQ